MQPHRSEYWLTSRPDDPQAFAREVQQVCQTYREAPLLAATQQVHTLSVDEKSGIQALERAAPTRPMKPNQIEKLEYEYVRHGTLCLIANLDVVTGTILAPSLGPTRTETDFVNHLRRTVSLDPQASWVFVCDRLNTHMSESLVRWVASECGVEDELGVKGKQGILKSLATRRAFLESAEHRLRFVYTPKHTSWLNQIECWFSTLVRRVLKRGNFSSTEALRERILEFIEYFNRTMAKPFRWTFTGRPLKV